MKSFFSCVRSGTLVAEYCKCGKDSDKFARTSQEQANCVVSTKASSMTKLSKDMEYKAFFYLMPAIQFLPLLVTWGNPKRCKISPSGDNEKRDVSLASLTQKLQQYWAQISPNLAQGTEEFVISGWLGSGCCGSGAVSALHPHDRWKAPGSEQHLLLMRCSAPSSSGTTLVYRRTHALRGLEVSIAHNLYYLIHFSSKEIASW